MTPSENPLNWPDYPKGIPPEQHNRPSGPGNGPIRAFE
jgi:hypothetical protein